MTRDERTEALTMNLEIAHHDIQLLGGKTQQLQTLAAQDGANIRSLIWIAEIHERGLTTLEGGSPEGSTS